MPRDSIAILLTSAGRRAELLMAFREAAAELEIGVTLHAADLSPGMSAACALADRAHPLPPATDPGYAASVLDIVTRHGIRLVVPTIDPELEPLAAARDAFARAGAHVAVGSPDLIAIARDKQRTSDFLRENGIPAPRSVRLETARAAGWQGPLFLKPCHGSSGRGARPIESLAAIAGQGFAEPMLVQEQLSGPEFTVNCYFDLAGRLRSVVPHERLQVRAGEVEKGITRREPQLEAIADRLAAALPGPSGALCFQAMRGADGQFQMFEINARFGGGYPLAHRAGATFTTWLVAETLGRPPAYGHWTPGVLMLRHDSSLFRMP